MRSKEENNSVIDENISWLFTVLSLVNIKLSDNFVVLVKCKPQGIHAISITFCSDVSEERRARLREVEIRVLQYQDELEQGLRSLKTGYSIHRQVAHYRHKMMRKVGTFQCLLYQITCQGSDCKSSTKWMDWREVLILIFYLNVSPVGKQKEPVGILRMESYQALGSF